MFRAISAFLFSFVLCALLPACGGGGDSAEKLAQGEVLVEAARTASSKAKTPKDVQPYDEALSWHEYHVNRVLGGKLDADTIRVAHWTVLAAKAVPVSTKKGEVVKLKLTPIESVPGLENLDKSDDLDFAATSPRFLDLSQKDATATPPKAFRYDYRGNVSEQMRLYWMLRGQLRTVIMGNSHATKSVNPRSIMDNDGWARPTMLNMAPAGANNELQCMMLQEYVLPLPKLEWLLWVVSPRNFNAEKVDPQKYKSFTSSPGWLYDQKHKSEFWPVPPSQKLVTTDEIKAAMGPMGLDVWGSLIVSKSLLPNDIGEHRKIIQEQCGRASFEFDKVAFAKFSETCHAFTEKGIKVLIFTTPFHPFTKDAVACDPDHTSHEGFRDFVRHMEEFDRSSPHLWFRDFHKDGAHEFPPDEFYDADHLDRKGTGRLGAMIQQWMAECQAQESTGGADSK